MWRLARAKAAHEPDLARRGRRSWPSKPIRPDLKARAFLGLWQVTGDEAARGRAVTEYERKGNVAAVARLAARALPS